MDEPDPITLSALQHWAYCPRQCGLIHLEQAFDDNLHTQRGQALHAQVDQPGFASERGVRVERALPLWHDALGLIGKADVVEFDKAGHPYPVEYKQGSKDKSPEIAACDELQLTAQAVCLESMTGHPVPEGALFYASSKRRRVVSVDAARRAAVVQTAEAVRAMLTSGRLPPPLTGDAARRRCKACSLHERCQPEAAGSAGLQQAEQLLFNPDADL
jgi:CRISPR-associated exonuclease Cas4